MPAVDYISWNVAISTIVMLLTAILVFVFLVWRKR